MSTLVIAPHPDDEILGAGGTLLRRLTEGFETHWLIMTRMTASSGWADETIRRRDNEIREVQKRFSFSSVTQLEHAPAQLDTVPLSRLVKDVGSVLSSLNPTEIFIPHLGDIHSDHNITHRVAVSCCKSFRMPSIKKILAYEVLSETDQGTDRDLRFFPQLYVDISEYLDQKVHSLSIYESEFQQFPFPRSITAVESLARVRGAASGFAAAEAFEVIRMRE